MPPLPYTHITDAYGFRNILENQKITPGFCNVFKENLLYLFYGRPAYRVGADTGKTSLNVFYPICILLKHDCLKTAERVYPFDSGAFDSGFFDDHMHKKFNCESFLVDPNLTKSGEIPLPDIPSRIVSAFFADNSNYYKNNKVVEPLNFGLLDFEVQCYHELIKTKKITVFDDRRSTIEIQTDKEIPLSSDTVEAVALPKSFMEDNEIFDAIVNKWKSTPLTYGISFHSTPDHFISLIIEEIGNFLKDKGCI